MMNNDTGFIAGAVFAAIVLGRIIEPLIGGVVRRIGGVGYDRRTSDHRIDVHEQRLAHVEDEVDRLRDGQAQIYNRLDEIRGQLSTLIGRTQ